MSSFSRFLSQAGKNSRFAWFLTNIVWLDSNKQHPAVNSGLHGHVGKDQLCMGTCQNDQKEPLHQGHGLPTLIFLSFINKRHKTKVELNILVSINNQSCLDSSSLTSKERSS